MGRTKAAVQQQRESGQQQGVVLVSPEVGRVEQVAVPLEAIYGVDRIYKLDENRMKSVEVTKVGERRTGANETVALVRSPALRDGDQIIVTQLPNAIDGLKVKAVPQDSGA